jgi:putative ABC transport system permease protein
LSTQQATWRHGVLCAIAVAHVPLLLLLAVVTDHAVVGLVGVLPVLVLLAAAAGPFPHRARALAATGALLVVPVEMPPPPGRSVGYPLQIDLDPLPVLNTVLVMALLATLASAWVARRTVRKPIVEALAHL